MVPTWSEEERSVKRKKGKGKNRGGKVTSTSERR